MEKLTKSPRLNYLLGSMDIFTPYQVIEHLPRRYDDLSYTKERGLEDKERVVLLGKLYSVPKFVQLRGISITTFDFVTVNKTFFRVKAFNRRYLSSSLDMENLFTITGVFNKKNNEIDLMNVYKGEIPKEERIKPVYSLPQEYKNY
ncbi:MAG: hypothetical protein K6F07_02145, partial [Bacilli bacterium]|nr:hypothetical protein [Bacilli bacterium]